MSQCGLSSLLPFSWVLFACLFLVSFEVLPLLLILPCLSFPPLNRPSSFVFQFLSIFLLNLPFCLPSLPTLNTYPMSVLAHSMLSTGTQEQTWFTRTLKVKTQCITWMKYGFALGPAGASACAGVFSVPQLLSPPYLTVWDMPAPSHHICLQAWRGGCGLGLEPAEQETNASGLMFPLGCQHHISSRAIIEPFPLFTFTQKP